MIVFKRTIHAKYKDWFTKLFKTERIDTLCENFSASKQRPIIFLLEMQDLISNLMNYKSELIVAVYQSLDEYLQQFEDCLDVSVEIDIDKSMLLFRKIPKLVEKNAFLHKH